MSDAGARATVMQMLNAAWVCQAISALTRLDLPDLLAKHGPRSARELTASQGVAADPEFLERVLRACASLGVFSEDADGRFGLTPLSEVLRRDFPGSAKRFAELYGGAWWEAFGRLPTVLEQGPPAVAEAWDARDDATIERFGEAMTSRLGSLVPGLARCDLSRARSLVDVGGGFGHVAIWLLRRHPELRATVLDLPDVARVAERRAARDAPELLGRLAFVAGDMLESVPAGDTYLLSGILHDWDDERCVRVLRNCRERMTAGGRVICLDAVLPPLGDVRGASAKLLDLLMMLTLPGKERTEPEWRALLERADLELSSVTTYDATSCASVVVAATGPPATSPRR